MSTPSESDRLPINEIEVVIRLDETNPRTLAAKLRYPGAPLVQHMDDTRYLLDAFHAAMGSITESLDRELRQHYGLPSRGEDAEARYTAEMHRRRTEIWGDVR